MATTADRISEFIVENYLFGDSSNAPQPDDSLVESGVIDSTGILELIEFLESEFQIHIRETETIPANLDSIDRLVRFVANKSEAGQEILT